MIKQATEKQKRFAVQISFRLGIELPNNDSIYAYSKFISDNLEKFKEAERKSNAISRKIIRECSRNIRQRRQTKYQNTYGGAYDSDIVDCYDFGISPWGDS